MLSASSEHFHNVMFGASGELWFGVAILALALLPMTVVVGGSVLWERLDRLVIGEPRLLAGLLVGRLAPFVNRATHDRSRRLVNNARDAFAANAAIAYGLVVPLLFLACGMWAPGSLAVAVVYHLVRIGPYFMNFAWVYTLCHKEGHLSRAGRSMWAPGVPLARLFNWWIGPFYGVFPASFSVGHVLNHHRHNNSLCDIITTAHRPRDSVSNFVAYLPRMLAYAGNGSTLVHFAGARDWPSVTRLLAGSFVYVAWIAAAYCWAGAWFVAVYAVYPFLENVVMLACINWCWHAFIDPTKPTNEYVLSVTILDGAINVLNEDHHAAHHQRPAAHWTGIPAIVNGCGADYQHGSVFKNTHVFELFTLIIKGDYDGLADHYVGSVTGASLDLTRPQIVHRLQQRLRFCLK